MQALVGTAAELQEHAELRQAFPPVLRADLCAHEGAVRERQRRLACPMTLFTADKDRLETDVVWAWEGYGNAPARRIWLQGDHLSVVLRLHELLGHIAMMLSGAVAVVRH